jgi:peroxiredoxin
VLILPDGVCSAAFTLYLYHRADLFADRDVQTLDDVMVGRYSESQKSYQIVRISRSDLFHRVSLILSYKMMLKRFLGIALLTCILFACETKQRPEEAAKVEESPAEVKGNDLPVMPVELVDGAYISMKDVNQKMVLVLFQPDCEDCQREASAIRKNLAAFAGYQLYFVSSHPLEVVKEFGLRYDLSTQPNVFFGRTTVENVLNNFGAIAAPSVYVFNEDGKMTANFNGEVAVDVIVKSL